MTSKFELQVDGLLKATDLMEQVRENNWPDADIPAVMNYLENNRHCIMPPEHDWAG